MAKNIEGEKVTESYNLFDLQSDRQLIPNTPNGYSDGYYSGYRQYQRLKQYKREEIDTIINSGDINQQRKLSRNFFAKDGAYRGYILYYATLLKYSGILIPNPGIGQSLSNSACKKKYIQAMDFIDRIPIKVFCENCAQKALTDGSYYGLIQKMDKQNFSYLDLPSEYCRSRFKDISGNDLIEFDLAYFNSIGDKNLRQIALDTYPEFVSNAYRKWIKGIESQSQWLLIPPDIGICFPMVDGRPFFLSVIPALMDLDEALEIGRERDLEEIRKIIVQKIPHNNENILLFEPDEALEIHKGTVEMMKGNKNVSVLTTYADVDAITSKTTADTTSSTIEGSQANVSRQSAVSDQIFSSTGSTTLSSSIKKDISMMMILANKFSIFFTNLVNRLYGNQTITFKYTILPITEQLKDDYIETSKKLATLGYSWMLPALAMDISQKDLLNIKDLENDVLGLQDKLIPLSSAYTQSGEVGAPKKKNEDKAEQTVKNETSKDNVMGGSK